MNILEKVKKVLRKNKIKVEGPVRTDKGQPIPVPKDPTVKDK